MDAVPGTEGVCSQAEQVPGVHQLAGATKLLCY